jgi:hypothetical protein
VLPRAPADGLPFYQRARFRSRSGTIQPSDPTPPRTPDTRRFISIMDMDELTSPTDVSATAGANRRVRPAATKTFQCRGYGDCTMVFSRSEHLAR